MDCSRAVHALSLLLNPPAVLEMMKYSFNGGGYYMKMKPYPIRNVNIMAAKARHYTKMSLFNVVQQETLCMPLIWIMTRQMETPGEGKPSACHTQSGPMRFVFTASGASG